MCERCTWPVALASSLVMQRTSAEGVLHFLCLHRDLESKSGFTALTNDIGLTASQSAALHRLALAKDGGLEDALRSLLAQSSREAATVGVCSKYGSDDGDRQIAASNGDDESALLLHAYRDAVEEYTVKMNVKRAAMCDSMLALLAYGCMRPCWCSKTPREVELVRRQLREDRGQSSNSPNLDKARLALASYEARARCEFSTRLIVIGGSVVMQAFFSIVKAAGELFVIYYISSPLVAVYAADEALCVASTALELVPRGGHAIMQLLIVLPSRIALTFSAILTFRDGGLDEFLALVQPVRDRFSRMRKKGGLTTAQQRALVMVLAVFTLYIIELFGIAYSSYTIGFGLTRMTPRYHDVTESERLALTINATSRDVIFVKTIGLFEPTLPSVPVQNGNAARLDVVHVISNAAFFIQVTLQLATLGLPFAAFLAMVLLGAGVAAKTERISLQMTGLLRSMRIILQSSSNGVLAAKSGEKEEEAAAEEGGLAAAVDARRSEEEMRVEEETGAGTTSKDGGDIEMVSRVSLATEAAAILRTAMLPPPPNGAMGKDPARPLPLTESELIARVQAMVVELEDIEWSGRMETVGLTEPRWQTFVATSLYFDIGSITFNIWLAIEQASFLIVSKAECITDQEKFSYLQNFAMVFGPRILTNVVLFAIELYVIAFDKFCTHLHP